MDKSEEVIGCLRGFKSDILKRKVASDEVYEHLQQLFVKEEKPLLTSNTKSKVSEAVEDVYDVIYDDKEVFYNARNALSLAIVILNPEIQELRLKTNHVWMLVQLCLLTTQSEDLIEGSSPPLPLDNRIVTYLLHSLTVNQEYGWVACLFFSSLVRASRCEFNPWYIDASFYDDFSRLIEHNDNFTVVNLLVGFLNSIMERNLHDQSINNFANYIAELLPLQFPVTFMGDYEIVRYYNSCGNNFKNLYQAESISCLIRQLNKSFDKGDIILLQLIQKTMIIWISNSGVLDPFFFNLDNLKSHHELACGRIKLVFKHKDEFWQKYSVLSAKLMHGDIVLELKLKNPSMKNVFVSTLTDLHAKPMKAYVAYYSNECNRNTLKNNDSQKTKHSLGKSNSAHADEDNNSQQVRAPPKRRKMNAPSHRLRVIESSQVLEPTTEDSSPRKNNLSVLSLGSGTRVSQQDIEIHSRKPNIRSSQNICVQNQDNELHNDSTESVAANTRSKKKESMRDITLLSPRNMAEQLQKASKKYGRKQNRPHKKDLWEFSSSTPSSPHDSIGVDSALKLPNATLVLKSFVPDSQASPTPLRNGPISKSNRRIKEADNIVGSLRKDIVPLEIPVTPQHQKLKVRHFSDETPVQKNAIDDKQVSNHNSNCYIYTGRGSHHQENSQRKLFVGGKMDLPASNDELYDAGHIAKSDRPISNKSTYRTVSAVSATSGVSDTIIRGSAAEDRSVESDMTDMSAANETTAKTSFLRYQSPRKHAGRQDDPYDQIYEGLNNMTTNIIERIKAFEADIVSRQRQLYEELEKNFNDVAKNHLANLDRFNDYIRKRNNELFSFNGS